jgi:taurine dioxygenase
VTTTTEVRPDYQVRPAGPHIGAEISGVDFSHPVDDATAEALRQDFIRYKVLVFRGVHLTPDQHVAAIRVFDEPFDHPTVAEAGVLTEPRVERHRDNRLVYSYNLKSGTADRWHFGGTWRTPPFSIESLSYQVVPEVGGHTLWSDVQAAYDDLSEPFRQLLESVRAVYDGNPENYGGRPDRLPLAETTEHPVVRTHRYTGRKGLFLSAGALRLTGIGEAEGKAILPFLLSHAASPNYTVGFGWKPGDFVLWDNLATLHYAVHDYDGPRAYRKVIAAQPAETA